MQLAINSPSIKSFTDPLNDDLILLQRLGLKNLKVAGPEWVDASYLDQSLQQ